MNESCRTHEWVKSQIRMIRVTHWMCRVTHMNEPSHIWLKRRATHMDELCHTYEWRGCHTCEWVMSHTWMCRCSTHMQESCSESSSSGAYFWNQSHETYAYAHMNVHESSHAYSWVVWRVWMSHAVSSLSVAPILEGYSMGYIAHTNAACRAYEWVMSHVNETCHTYEAVGAHMWIKSCQKPSLHQNWSWFDQQFNTKPLLAQVF